MDWLVFSYSLPSKSKSGPRVALWRRLGRIGAISPTTGVYVLPARDECLEAFQWLAQEIRQAKGDALMMRVEQFEGLSDQQIIDLFNAARRAEYEALDQDAAELEKTAKKKGADRSQIQDSLEKLRRRFADIARVDYFDSPAAAKVSARLTEIAQSIAPAPATPKQIASATVAAYRDKRWVTRPRPHVDRLACVWLIRRFINPNAVIRYSLTPQSDEIPFDMEGAEFGHQGNLCTFETMLAAFGLDEASLRAISEIVHEIDLRDGRNRRPEIAGIDAILRGWLLANLSDTELEQHGMALFEGLYSALSNTPAAKRGAATLRVSKRTTS